MIVRPLKVPCTHGHLTRTNTTSRVAACTPAMLLHFISTHLTRIHTELHISTYLFALWLSITAPSTLAMHTVAQYYCPTQLTLALPHPVAPCTLLHAPQLGRVRLASVCEVPSLASPPTTAATPSATTPAQTPKTWRTGKTARSMMRWDQMCMAGQRCTWRW